MTKIPKDPAILLGYINTQLRDYYPSLTDCCLSLGISMEEVSRGLASIDCFYNEEKNQFV